MSASINEVTLLGYLGRDPEARSTSTGGRIVNLSVATSESWKDRNTNERKERTEWHKVVIFNEGLIGVAEKYLKKGSRVWLRGKLQTRKWQGQDGKDNYTTEVVLQNYAGELKLMDGAGGASSTTSAQSGPVLADDDIPF